jgi:hypothetical protein
LQDAIVAQLRDIPELVEFIGDADDIQAYDDESRIHGNPELTEFSMMGRAVMIVWAGAEMPRTGDTRGWRHRFKIFLKAESVTAYYDLAQLIFDGTPAGECDNFLNVTVHPSCDGIQDADLSPEQGDDGVERLTITFSLTEM